MKNKIIKILSFNVIGSVGIAFASSPRITNLQLAQGLVNMISPFFIGLSIVFFFCGLIIFTLKRKDGGRTLEVAKKLMIYAFIIFFAIFSFQLILRLLFMVRWYYN